MTVDLVHALGRGDVADSHAFSHPDHVLADASVLEFLIRDAVALAAEAGDVAITVHIPDEAVWHRRVQIPDPVRLRSTEAMTVVGFFGRVKDVVDPAVAAKVSDTSELLAQSVFSVPGLLAYSSHQLADERNYANLVLVSDAAVVADWRAGHSHAFAAERLAPQYYEYVRIYNATATFDHRARSLPCVDMICAKYWDYRMDPMWQAVRSFG